MVVGYTRELPQAERSFISIMSARALTKTNLRDVGRQLAAGGPPTLHPVAAIGFVTLCPVEEEGEASVR